MLFVATALCGAAACVDLFHSTDFATLCAFDAAACSTDTGSTAPDADEEQDAGADVYVAPIDFCSNSPAAARQLAERACGWLGACLGSRENSSYAECLVRALSAYDCSFNPSLRPREANAVLWDCLSKVSSCNALELCVFGTPAPPCPGQGVGSFTACNLPDGGAVVVGCAEEETPTGMEACALRGRTCARVDQSTALCTGRLGAACTGPNRCLGTAAIACKSAGGIDSDEGTDCAAVGDGRCAADDAGVACAPRADAGACTIAKSSKIVCNDAGTAESCVGGRAVTIDCKALGQTCSEGIATSVDPSSACTNVGGLTCDQVEDQCDAGVLQSCRAKTLFALDCKKIGLGACTKAAGRWAACTAP
ncbi:MAG TPA: hypothetical protein VM925_32370 [Labilithrix sp.]|nr:hypothetical protein [Labilithrix sp.]